MKVDCSRIEPWVQQYLDRELGEPQQRELLGHLDECRTCQATYGPLLEAIRDVEQAAAPQVPAGLLERVLGELPTVQVGPATQTAPIRQHPSRLILWCSGVAAAAAILLATISRVQMIDVTRNGPGSDPRQMAQAKIDPQTMMWLASAACTAPVGNSPTSLGLVAGQMAAWQAQQAGSEPVRITLCMATPPIRSDQPETPPMSDVLQMISNRAALHGGM